MVPPVTSHSRGINFLVKEPINIKLYPFQLLSSEQWPPEVVIVVEVVVVRHLVAVVLLLVVVARLEDEAVEALTADVGVLPVAVLAAVAVAASKAGE